MNTKTILEKFTQGMYNDLDGTSILAKDLKALDEHCNEIKKELDISLEECHHMDALLDKMKG